MYVQHRARLIARALPITLALLGWSALFAGAPAQAQSIVKKLEAPNEKLELTVNSSRILTLDQNIPRVQVNNPEVLSVTPLSKDQVQISAKRPGVTDVNLWGEDGSIYAVNVVVYGDVAELQLALDSQYPHSSVKVHRYSNSLILSGYVDRPDYVSSIVRLAEDYAPKIINNISVGGVQQILLNVQVMEVSRTKLRALGFDFTNIDSGASFVGSSISGLIATMSTTTGTVSAAAGDTVRFGVIGNNSFFGFLKALRANNMMKILAEPKLVTVSGRPASFNSGGEFPVLVPQSLGTVSIEYKKFGTQVEFMPLVLGNGNIRLEVRPRVSEIDSTRSVQIQDYNIPALRVREVDTAVEMKAGQTLALAGLIQSRQEAQNRGIPVLADIPFLGAAFRSVDYTNNEIELLILVRPELVDPLDPHQCPPGGPGRDTCPPGDWDLYTNGLLEVPCGMPCITTAEGEYLPLPLEGEPLPAPPADESLRRDAPPAATPPRDGSPGVERAPMTRSSTPGYRRSAASTPSAPPSSESSGGRTATIVPRVPAAQPSDDPGPGLIGPVGYDIVK